jgi:hypothetical protein
MFYGIRLAYYYAERRELSRQARGVFRFRLGNLSVRVGSFGQTTRLLLLSNDAMHTSERAASYVATLLSNLQTSQSNPLRLTSSSFRLR